MHHPKRVFESSMHGAGIQLVGPCELTDAPEALKHRLVNDRPLPVIGLDEAMDRATDLMRFVRVQVIRTILSDCVLPV